MAAARPLDVVELALEQVQDKLPAALIEAIRSWGPAKHKVMLEAAADSAADQLRQVEASLLSNTLLLAACEDPDQAERIEFLRETAVERELLLNALEVLEAALEAMRSGTQRKRNGHLRLFSGGPPDGDPA